MCFVDAANANDLHNSHRLTAGYDFLLCSGTISWRSTTQTICATSSTEAEFLAAVLAAKYSLPSCDHEGTWFAQLGPTPIYEDNESCIKMINARIPTARSRHIDIQHFAIQDWKDAGDIVMRHIPGIISPPDDLTKPTNLGLTLASCSPHHGALFVIWHSL